MKKEKYELTDEWRKGFDGEKVYRIVAMRDIPVHDVSKGDMGGFLSGYGNLSQIGDSWVAGEAIVEGEAYVCGDAWVAGKARVFGKSRLEEKAYVYRSARIGNSKLNGDCEVYGTAIVNSSKIEGKVIIKGKAELMASRLYGEILVKDEVFLMETVVRGKDIYLLGKSVIKRTTIGDITEKTHSITICGAPNLNGVGMTGDDILIENFASLSMGVQLNGTNIRIADHVFLEGNVRFLSNSEIRDVVQVKNTKRNVLNCEEYGEITLLGDLELGE